MRANLLLSCVILGLVTSSNGASQRLNWIDFFREGASRDPVVRDGARQTLSSLGIGFWNVEADVLRTDVQAMLPAFDDPDPDVRLEVSAIVSALALGRQDSATVLEGAVPTLLAHFKDPDPRVHRNAVTAIINLKPEIPANTLEALLAMLRDADVETAAAATHGITRLALNQRAALVALQDLLKRKDIPERVRIAAVQTIGVSKSRDPELVGLLAVALEDTNGTTVLEGILAAAKLGWVPETLELRLHGLAEMHSDPEIRRAAGDALQRLHDSH